MNCMRCGKELAPFTKICSDCGTVTFQAQPSSQSNTSYGQFPIEQENLSRLSPKYDVDGEDGEDGEHDSWPNYEAGYVPQQRQMPIQPSMPPPLPPLVHLQPQPQPRYYGYGATPIYQPPPVYVMAMPQNAYVPIPATKNVGALIAEIFLSMIGIFGVGWLIAGETMVGVVLLVCSFLVIMPIALFIAFITFGIGIFVCDLPLAIAGIIINAILLNNALNRKAQQQYYYAQPAQQMPPPMQRMRMPPR